MTTNHWHNPLSALFRCTCIDASCLYKNTGNYLGDLGSEVCLLFCGISPPMILRGCVCVCVCVRKERERERKGGRRESCEWVCTCILYVHRQLDITEPSTHPISFQTQRHKNSHTHMHITINGCYNHIHHKHVAVPMMSDISWKRRQTKGVESNNV